MVGGMGGWEWAIILVIIVIIFGAGKLPEIGGALGKSLREFRNASSPENSADRTDTPVNQGEKST